MKSTLQECNISLNDIDESILPQKLRWIIKKPEVNSELNELPKTKPPSHYLSENLFPISSNTIPTTYMSLRMDPRTITKRRAQLF